MAPRFQIDYTAIGLGRWDPMSAEDFLVMISNPKFLGNPTLKTQHLIGATWWEKVSDTEVIGHHQIRAAHQVYTGPDLQTVKLKGHGHGTNENCYRKVNGVWKFAGLKPTVRWNEGHFEEIIKELI
jgi:scytalone dehydratase